MLSCSGFPNLASLIAEARSWRVRASDNPTNRCAVEMEFAAASGWYDGEDGDESVREEAKQLVESFSEIVELAIVLQMK